MADIKSPMPGFKPAAVDIGAKKHAKDAFTKDQQTQSAKSLDSPNGGVANPFTQSHKGKG